MKFSLAIFFSLVAGLAVGSSIPIDRTSESLIDAEGADAVGFANVTLDARVDYKVDCYNHGTHGDRGDAGDYITNFCSTHKGVKVPNGGSIYHRYGPKHGVTFLVSGKAINGCSFVVDDNCYEILRRIRDRCGKGQKTIGGVSTDPCGRWRLDPGSRGSDT